MTRAVFIFILFILSLSCFGQKVRFTDSTNRWNVRSYDMDGSGYHYSRQYYFYYGDSTYKGNSYKLLFGGDGFFGSPSLVREDTTLNKVFIVINDSEEVLMDYNLIVGDVASHYRYDSHPGVRTTYYVDKLDSTIINGVWHKVWNFKTISTCYDYIVIEGIGCLNGPLFINDPCLPLIHFDLICFEEFGVSPLVSPLVGGYFDNYYSCTPKPLPWLNEYHINNKKTTILYPNPSNTTLNITSTDRITTLVITNLVGETIYSNNYSSDDVLVDVSRLSAGVYLVRINGNEVRKFVKQ